MPTTEKYTVRVTLFGPLTLENHLGTVTESNAQPWLLLKYLLAHRGRDIPQAELDEALPIKGGANAARVRLSRLRDLLAPLWTGDKKRVLNQITRAFWEADLEQGSGLDFSGDRPIMKPTISEKERDI